MRPWYDDIDTATLQRIKTYSAFNDPESKNLMVQTMYEYKQEEIAELEKACEETQELLDRQIEATYKLDKENAELKSRDCWKSCEYANPKTELIGQHIKDVQNLTKAKELLKKLLSAYTTYADSFDDRDNEIVEEAEQFLNSEVEK